MADGRMDRLESGQPLIDFVRQTYLTDDPDFRVPDRYEKRVHIREDILRKVLDEYECLLDAPPPPETE